MAFSSELKARLKVRVRAVIRVKGLDPAVPVPGGGCRSCT